ncbi:hypothetical protein RB195_001007 [Necator americanus]|uniref:Uncharacterized protein n=1 Tax=Necator americanus TaxID=51031 RepID=A0ABR1DCS9_NECAM
MLFGIQCIPSKDWELFSYVCIALTAYGTDTGRKFVINVKNIDVLNLPTKSYLKTRYLLPSIACQKDVVRLNTSRYKNYVHSKKAAERLPMFDCL